MALLLKIDPGKPDEEKLAEVVRILRGGGVVGFPTETFYGLGADARNEAAVEREGGFHCYHED
ncbi:MAG: Sua5/YciO/YrdC/YwlC family protein [Rectinemataceae bacterium]|nr:Sua5/YciO/YrdC/YwlC family protein [Rectinemataceae bacterium]